MHEIGRYHRFFTGTISEEAKGLALISYSPRATSVQDPKLRCLDSALEPGHRKHQHTWYSATRASKALPRSPAVRSKSLPRSFYLIAVICIQQWETLSVHEGSFIGIENSALTHEDVIRCFFMYGFCSLPVRICSPRARLTVMRCKFIAWLQNVVAWLLIEKENSSAVVSFSNFPHLLLTPLRESSRANSAFTRRLPFSNMLVIDILQTFLHLWSDVQTPSYMPVPAQTPSTTLSLPWNTYTATYHPKTSGIADVCVNSNPKDKLIWPHYSRYPFC